MEWVWKAEIRWIWWETERATWEGVLQKDGKCQSDKGSSSWFQAQLCQENARRYDRGGVDKVIGLGKSWARKIKGAC